MNATNMEKARAQIVIHHPFFAGILLRRKMEPRSTIPKMGVDKRGQMFYNPEWCETLSVNQLVFALAHEVLHVALLHFARLGNRDPKKANVAQDAVINESLVKSKIGTPIEDCVRWPGAELLSWEEVYNLMPDDIASNIAADGIGSDMLDEGEEISEADASDIEHKIRLEVAQCAHSARMTGKLPAWLARLAGEAINPKQPWHKHLEQFMDALAQSNDYAWSRPNRRYVSSGIYLPGRTKDPKMGEVVIVVDTSGSIGDKELAEFGAHVNDILEQCAPDKAHVLYIDSDVARHDEYNAGDYPITLTPLGGGGTDMEAAYKYCDERGIAPDVMIFLSDLHTAFSTPPDYPTFWVSTSHKVAPYGVTIQLTY